MFSCSHILGIDCQILIEFSAKCMITTQDNNRSSTLQNLHLKSNNIGQLMIERIIVSQLIASTSVQLLYIEVSPLASFLN